MIEGEQAISNIDYENFYKENFDRNYNERFYALEKLLSNDDGFQASVKLIQFRNDTCRIYWDLFVLNPELENSGTDKYAERLRDAFRFRETNYTRDHIKLFFKNDVAKLVSEYNLHKHFEASRIANYSESDMLLFLANERALKKILDDTEHLMMLTSDGILVEFEKLKRKVYPNKHRIPDRKNINGFPKQNGRKKIENLKVLIINPHFTMKTLEAVKTFFNEKDHDKLKELLHGASLNKVFSLVKGKEMGPFVGVFRTLSKNKKIAGSNIHLFRWLNHYFQFYNKKQKSYTSINMDSAKNIIETNSNNYRSRKLKIRIEGLDSDL